MKNTIILFFLILTTSFSRGQSKETLIKLSNKWYWEDQLYLSITYNKLIIKKNKLPNNEFSYGLALGYIKDIPFHKKGNWALGVGLGYNYDYLNHITHVNQIEKTDVLKNKINFHHLEIPLQIRWRNSDALNYSFWRIYSGLRFGYNFYNSYHKIKVGYPFTNISNYKKFQLGYEISAGYGSINFFIYHSLLPIFKDEDYNSNTHIAKFGLIFYFL